MRMTFPRYSIISLGLFLTACSGLGFRPGLDAPSETQPAATSTPLQTPTIIWFPTTATPTPQPFPTQLSTPKMLTDLGNVIASDDFSDATSWNTASSDQGTASINRNRLTLVVQPGIYLTSLQQEFVLGDFYAEITARPSLCRDTDSYGMLVRANLATYYRFALSCNGMVHAERISVNERHVLYKPVPSGDVPPGAPGEVRIGVWAAGPEMRFFLNGRFQFSVTDTNLSSGTIGVFASSSGDTPVTVTFSDLVVRAVTYILPTKTLIP